MAAVRAAPPWVAVALLATFQPEPPRSTTVFDPVGTELTGAAAAGLSA
jgi:hypothetical protein